jgi:Arylsulfotransferase (ASST)
LGVRRTRKDFLRVVAGGGALLALGTLAACEPDPRIRASASPRTVGRRWAFRSRPDLSPPPVEVVKRSRATNEGYLFAAPKNGPGEAYPAKDGPMILDDGGRPVWFRPVPEEGQDAMDFKVQRYRGEPVLTWWQGVHGGWGDGEYLIFDGSYREVARVRAGNGFAGDHHEFLVTERDTALITIYRRVRMDLSPFGGPRGATVMDGVVQELDIETGDVLFEWHSLEHVDFEESTAGPNPDQRYAYDYFHLNSVAEDNDGNLLVGARKTSAVYKVDRESGEVIWRLGGKRSDFAMGEGVRFAFQHDARRQKDGTITIFDNRGADMDEPSRAIRLWLDEEAMTAELASEYTLPEDPFAIFQASVQDLPNGNVFVGWGSAPFLSEHTRDGALLFEARFPKTVESYRAFRSGWVGRPKDRPAVVAEVGSEEGSEERVTLYVSWNGATEVASWEILTGPGPDGLEPLGSAPRKGFETQISFNTDEPYVAIRAKDRWGRNLGTSEAATEVFRRHARG